MQPGYCSTAGMWDICQDGTVMTGHENLCNMRGGWHPVDGDEETCRRGADMIGCLFRSATDTRERQKEKGAEESI